jgi:hypothetical protein
MSIPLWNITINDLATFRMGSRSGDMWLNQSATRLRIFRFDWFCLESILQLKPLFRQAYTRDQVSGAFDNLILPDIYMNMHNLRSPERDT